MGICLHDVLITAEMPSILSHDNWQAGCHRPTRDSTEWHSYCTKQDLFCFRYLVNLKSMARSSTFSFFFFWEGQDYILCFSIATKNLGIASAEPLGQQVQRTDFASGTVTPYAPRALVAWLLCVLLDYTLLGICHTGICLTRQKCPVGKCITPHKC